MKHIEQYAALAMYEPAIARVLERVNSPELLAAHVADHAKDARNDVPHRMQDGIAVFDVIGPVSKYGSSLSPAPAMVDLRRAIRAAVADKKVNGILLHIDSPGGTVAGVADLSDDIHQAAQVKPVHAFIEDLGASAAYFIASQASTITATESSLVGSIGVYTVLRDVSKMYEDRGIKTIVVRSGKYKGAGYPGTEIDEETIKEVQRTIDAHHTIFVEHVARGREIPADAVEELADGSIHIAGEAKARGLIDRIGGLDDAMGQFKSTPINALIIYKTLSVTDAGEPALSETEVQTMANDERTPATLEDLLSCLGGIDSERDGSFILEQLKTKATLDQARSAWEEEQVRQRQEAEAREQSALKRAEEAEAAAKTKPGVEPLGTGIGKGDAAGNPQEEWEQLIRNEMKLGRPRAAAVRSVARKNPQLREALVAAAN